VQGGTTPEGIHLGAMAGMVDLLERGYTGLELRHNALHFNPALPDHLSALRIRIRYRGHSLTVAVVDGTLAVTSAESEVAPIQVGCGDRVQELRAGASLRFDIG
jgi:trehalose/maltose hydrolase-like predicted phosphorylase